MRKNLGFSMVQRVIPRKEPNEYKKGIDRWFQFDYMGKAEFEFGALGDALRTMRANRISISDPMEIVVGNYRAWFIGDEKDFVLAKNFFDTQLNNKYSIYLMEPSFIDRAYNENDYSVSGWWILDAKTPWCIFKSKEDAKRFKGWI